MVRQRGVYPQLRQPPASSSAGRGPSAIFVPRSGPIRGTLRGSGKQPAGLGLGDDCLRSGPESRNLVQQRNQSMSFATAEENLRLSSLFPLPPLCHLQA
eukprot:scaffold315819_cov31-Prasinocladus_malaysianus.AAC.1